MRVPQKDILKCDLCRHEVLELETVNYPVMFTTEQTEGRGVPLHVSQEKLELCKLCLNRACVIFGAGAQGCNEYWLKGR